MGPYQASARKRKRTQGAEQEQSFEVIKSEKFWFEDGSVVLQVANTQFRVHCSTLSRHSSVFRDMFNMQKLQKSDADELVEGCPVIILADRPEDIEYLLSIFYDSIRVHDLREQMDIEYISAILRLGKKYDIDYLKEEGLQRLHSEFPLTLEDWDRRNERKNKGFQIIDINDADNVIEVINLAHELSIETVLPAAYLLCIQTTDTEEIVDNAFSSCGSDLEMKGISATNLHPTAFKAYLTGRNRLLCEVHKVIIGWFCSTDIISGPGCSNTAQCATRKSETIASLRTVKNFNYICALDEGKVPSNAPVCRICRLSLERTIHEMRQEMWKNLPSMFGLSQWEELKDFEGDGC